MNTSHQLTRESLGFLPWPFRHMPLLATQRAVMMLDRVRVIALFLSAFTTTWIVIDMVSIPWPIWGKLLIGCLVSCLAFLALGYSFRHSRHIRDAHNDGYGHEAGDQALPAASHVLERVRAAGLGLRPDGSSLTTSIGVAERVLDDAEDWSKLVEIFDQRMYQAKTSGNNCIVLPPGLAINVEAE